MRKFDQRQTTYPIETDLREATAENQIAENHK